MLKLLSVENASDDSKADADEVKQQLEKLTPIVKDIAGNYKKAGLTSAE